MMPGTQVGILSR